MYRLIAGMNKYCTAILLLRICFLSPSFYIIIPVAFVFMCVFLDHTIGVCIIYDHTYILYYNMKIGNCQAFHENCEGHRRDGR